MIRFETYNFDLFLVELRGFSAAIFEKLRGVARLFPKKEAKSVCTVYVANEPLQGILVGRLKMGLLVLVGKLKNGRSKPCDWLNPILFKLCTVRPP